MYCVFRVEWRSANRASQMTRNKGIVNEQVPRYPLFAVSENRSNTRQWQLVHKSRHFDNIGEKSRAEGEYTAKLPLLE
jgi:hypothetical protein